ncbi:hypothetical protein FHX81_6985 [Saccharothrix saharensis]|uniref:Ig-like domain-containing protein n=1 Tax=Saccharothrix saharensis TaxID=571190 RepID=A0A543JNU8_9PSEU|nr:hypothetical protein [Saccharothrix saharensis]TQM84531.1 hypothetical protein FHX81_6985 [Saccharothrix saharensis]
MRSIRGLLILSALITLSLLFPPSSAHATPGDLTCTENESVTYSPGLLTTPRPVDVSVHNVLSCTSLTDPAVISGHVQATIRGLTRSCSDLAASGKGSYTITWHTGHTSTIDYTRSANYVLGTLVIVESGTVTAGKFTGASTTHIVELANLNLPACLTEPGLTTAAGIGTYVFA